MPRKPNLNKWAANRLEQIFKKQMTEKEVYNLRQKLNKSQEFKAALFKGIEDELITAKSRRDAYELVDRLGLNPNPDADLLRRKIETLETLKNKLTSKYFLPPR